MDSNCNIKFKTHALIERAVEAGVYGGYHRAHKHTNDPTEDYLVEQIVHYIMLELDEIIDFNEGESGESYDYLG